MHACPHCGADLRASATFCRECGSDARTGWSDEAESTGQADLGLDDFDYEAYLERELGTPAAGSRRWVRWLLAAMLVPILWALLNAR
ncbi:MAG: zinc ribbon domain-containing protein [Planctomycetota bacterium]